MVLRFADTVPILEIPPELDFDALRAWVPEATAPHLEAIGGRTCRLDLGERELHLFDLRRLIHLLRDSFGVEISGLYVHPEAIHRYAERELKLKLFPINTVEEPTEEFPPAVLEPVAPPAAAEQPEDDFEGTDAIPESTRRILPLDPNSGLGRRTLSLHKTLRSGASIRFDGDVLVFGDVNPGAQVIASGNVVVLGILKGMAHAGATGDDSSYIFAFDLQPTQLRIGRKIAIPPSAETRLPEPEFARMVDDQIVIDPYRARFSR